MDMNVLLNKMKQELGIGKYLKIDKTDREVIEDIIIKVSLPMFSRYFKHKMLLRGINLEKVDDNGLYRIPLTDDMIKAMEQHGVYIKGISKINRNEKTMSAYFNSPMYVPNFNGARYNSSFGVDSFANSLTYATMAEAFDPGMHPMFIEPYFIRFTDPVVNYTLFKFDVELNTSHSTNLSTIPESYGTSFESLVKLDMKHILYQELKYIDNIETPYSVVQLKIDDWANAEEEKKALIDSFKDANIIINPQILF